MSSAHFRHSSHTLSTAYASRTHVKALQTDFHAKPNNSSGSTYDSPPESLLRTKATFQHQKAPKSIENIKQREDHPSQAPTNSPPCPSQSGIGTKARRAASRPSPYPPRCSEPWKKPLRHQVRLHGSMPRFIEAFKAWFRDWFRFLSLWKERLSLSFSLYLYLTIVSTIRIELYI